MRSLILLLLQDTISILVGHKRGSFFIWDKIGHGQKGEKRLFYRTYFLREGKIIQHGAKKFSRNLAWAMTRLLDYLRLYAIFVSAFNVERKSEWVVVWWPTNGSKAAANFGLYKLVGNQLEFIKNTEALGAPDVRKILGEEVLDEKVADSIIKDLQKAYAPLKGKTISPEMANKMSKHLDGQSFDVVTLRQLMKAQIPFISTLARNKIYKKTGKFEETNVEDKRLYVEAIAGLQKKADKSGMPYSILKKVYDRVQYVLKYVENIILKQQVQQWEVINVVDIWGQHVTLLQQRNHFLSNNLRVFDKCESCIAKGEIQA